jgi:two-component system probable response regulator PhcQ
VDVVISDEKMPGMSGSEFLSLVRQEYPDTIRIILTGYGSLESAIRAINEGEIYRLFTKPCNVIDLAITIRLAL